MNNFSRFYPNYPLFDDTADKVAALQKGFPACSAQMAQTLIHHQQQQGKRDQRVGNMT
jgi:hypothetical protein